MNVNKTKLEKQVIDFLNSLEPEMDISQQTNRYLIEKFYNHIGFNEESTMNEWFIGLSTKKYPPFSTVEKVIRTERNHKLEWRKQNN